jgi:hypothetical protein
MSTFDSIGYQLSYSSIDASIANTYVEAEGLLTSYRFIFTAPRAHSILYHMNISRFERRTSSLAINCVTRNGTKVKLLDY